MNMRVAWLGVISAFFSMPAAADTTAETSNFKINGSKVPISATTTFYIPIWTDGDATNTAHHELLHAIGFSINYDKFSGHVDGSRNFRKSDNATGDVLAKLTPADQGTHTDPGAGTVNGFDQAESVMQPSRVTGQRMAAQEKSVLNAAVDWSSRNLNINVSYVGTFSNAQKGYIQDAVSSAKTLFNSNATGHTFTWTLKLANAVVVAGMPRETKAIETPEVLVSQVDARAGSTRVATSAEILRRGTSMLPELVRAGARPMSGLTPRRIDVLYSLLSGRHEGRYRTGSFGLHVEPGTTREEILAMGERHGFILASDEAVEPNHSPCCYVTLREGSDLWGVFSRLIASEQKVTTLSLNYLEP